MRLKNDMKNDKITIDIYPLSEKLTIIAAIIFVTAFLIISFIVDGIAWWIIVCYFLGEIACVVGAYRILRSKIVLDESLEVLKLYDFRSRIIPVEEIKVIEREDVPSAKGSIYYEFKIITYQNVVHDMHMLGPEKGSKRWKRVNDDLKRLNRRIKELKKIITKRKREARHRIEEEQDKLSKIGE